MSSGCFRTHKGRPLAPAPAARRRRRRPRRRPAYRWRHDEHGHEGGHAAACAAGCRQPRFDPRARRACEQPQGPQRRDPEASADRVHRHLRLGQELSGVRHDRCGVAAADQRDVQRLRAGLHADAGAARGRCARRADDRDHRRPAANGRRPPLHGRDRHDHRAAPGRPGRPEAIGADAVGGAGGARCQHPQPAGRRCRHTARRARGGGRRGRVGKELAAARLGVGPGGSGVGRPGRDPRLASEQPGDLHRTAGPDPQGVREGQRREAGAVQRQLRGRLPQLR